MAAKRKKSDGQRLLEGAGRSVAQGTRGALEYAKRTTPQQFGQDVRTAGKAIARDTAAAWRDNPSKFIADAVLDQTTRPIADVVRGTQTARRTGRDEDFTKAGGAAMALAAGLVPGGRAEKKVVETGAKAVGAAATKREAARLAEKYALSESEQAARNLAARKAEREAKARKLVQAQKAAGVAPSEAPKAPPKGGKRALGTSATVLRDMAREKGDEAVLRAASQGKHLIRTGDGYVGAPRTITNAAGLGSMRKTLDRNFDDAVKAVGSADNERMGTWYGRAKKATVDSTEPYQRPSTLAAHALYSAGVSPQSELAFALKHQTSRALSKPVTAFRKQAETKLDEAAARGTTPKQGAKTGEYLEKLDPSKDVDGLFGVNDFRAAQNFGYVDPEGEPWKAAVSEAMHRFMDAETALAVKRANSKLGPGERPWTGPQLQELPWVLGKAQDLYGRGREGRFAGPGGFDAAIREANKTSADFLPDHTFSATYEYRPGDNTGHMPSMRGLSDADYGKAGAWATRSPEVLEGLPTKYGMGEDELVTRDALYRAYGMRQRPSIENTEGYYVNAAGQAENNTGNIARPLTYFDTGNPNKGGPATHSMDVFEATEGFRALNDAQEAGAGHHANTTSSGKNKSGLLIDTGGRQATSAQLKAVNEAIAAHPEMSGRFGATASDRGIAVLPFGDPGAAKAHKMLSPETISKLVEGGTHKPAMLSSTYVPGLAKFDADYNLVPTAPGSGEATEAVLRRFADLPQGVSRDLGESEEVRRLLKEKYLRDEGHPEARGDLQNTRKFFAERDWPKVVALMRKGMGLAGALAALGWTTGALAEEQPE